MFDKKSKYLDMFEDAMEQTYKNLKKQESYHLNLKVTLMGTCMLEGYLDL